MSKVKTIKSDKCIICGSNKYEIIFSYDAPDEYEQAVGLSSKNYRRNWVRCSHCGFYYSQYSRDPFLLDSIYDISYRKNDSSWRSSSNEEIFNKVINLPKNESETTFRVKWIKDSIQSLSSYGLINYSNSPRRMLDIGGGTGVFAHEFKDERWISHVIDSDQNAMFIEDKLKIPFACKRYQPKSFDFSFDLITMIFVLEHLLDPEKILNQLHQDMMPNSLIYIEVPDSICFHYKAQSDDIYNSCHLWMFSPNTILPLLDRCGFNILRLNRMKTMRGHFSLMVLASQKMKDIDY